ncbi:hypothetical protein C943_01905 [Mariniradius saccharolyticus AK6]|uniref:Uncharacterized protein n=1 Tax=Mariniradius saccharolyticus AK6 TaxID=1239962 RepID=M7X9M0_9BACT|nr:hypothetical protein C943_01905 [Mariniradius saccharolyticus AK6]
MASGANNRRYSSPAGYGMKSKSQKIRDQLTIKKVNIL